MVTPFHLVAALVAAHAALGAELYAPTLQFNWTLRPFDAPLKLSGWSPSDTANIGGTWTLPSTSNTATASVQFIGTALWYNGVGSNWAQTDSNGNAKVAGYASVVGDPSWAATTAETDLLQPASATVLWEHSTPRFQTYTMNIQAVYGSWTLDSAVIATGLNTTSSSITSLDDVPRTVVNFVGSDSQVNSTFYNLTGRWDVTDAAGSLPQHTTCYDDAVARIALPPGTSFIVINGTRSTASGNLYIKLAPVTDEYDQTTYVVDASFPYTTDAILFVLPIDTAVAQTLILDCVLEAQGQQGLTSITFYGWDGSKVASTSTGQTGSSSSSGANSSSGSTTSGGSGSSSSSGASSSSSSGLSKSAIIAIAVVVVVAVLAGLLAWCLFARRKRRARKDVLPAQHAHGVPAYQSGALDGEIDPNVYPTPYAYQPQQPATHYFDKPGGNPSNIPPPSYGQPHVSGSTPAAFKY